MIDQIEQLEGRVQNLMGLIDTLRQENDALRRENGEQRDRLEQMSAVKAHNEELQNHLMEIENEVEGHSRRDTQVRERLQAILGKIDALERQVGGQLNPPVQEQMGFDAHDA
jgi:chromosome segregation ATPase